MQDFHSIPGLSGRFFVAGGVGGGGIVTDQRRLRGYTAGGQEPPVKCPRCDSVNTKFCYYNNYNLSQPRHFCKSCRRYWTKGGFLRNVPVGGGCRKSSAASKRSSSSKKSSSSSSSDSCSPNPKPKANPDLVPVAVPAEPVIFHETGNFSSLMAAAASGPEALGFDFSDPPPFRPPVQQPAAAEVEMRMQGLMAGLIEQGRINGEGMNGLDWPGSVEPGIFDLTSSVDPAAYWNQSHWGDADPSSLFLP